MANQPSGPRPWDDHDTAIWHTLDILAAVLTSQLQERPATMSPFPPSMGPGERMLSQGGYDRLQYMAAGDGSYDSSMFIAGGTGVLGLGLLAGTALASAAGNASRRSRAQEAAQERWRPLDSGLLWISTHGFYLQNPHGLLPWSWPAVTSAMVAGPAAVHLQGQTDGGVAVSWIVRSHFAELLFVLWALYRHPGHPQLVTGGWLPPGWAEHARAHGHLPEQQLARITTALTAGR